MTNLEKTYEASKFVTDNLKRALDGQNPDAPEEPTFNAGSFFDVVRAELYNGRLVQSEVDGHNQIGFALALFYKDAPRDKLWPLRQQAYILATSYHETGHTMQPIEEWGKGAGKPYAPNWYGRGYVQLTWEENYYFQEAKMHAHHDLLGQYEIPYQVHNRPEYALDPRTSAIITIGGMKDGDFTGKSLADYITEGSCDYVEARRIVNGTDRQHDIAGYAESYERAIKAGWGIEETET